MLKKIFITITIILIVGVALGWFYFARESKYYGNSALNAVPIDAPFFTRIRNIASFAKETKNNPIWKEYAEIKGLDQLYSNLSFIDSMVQANVSAQAIFNTKELIVVFDDKSQLNIVEIGSMSEKLAIKSFIRKYFEHLNIKEVEQNTDTTTISEYSRITKDGKKSFYCIFYKGLCLSSNSLNLLKKGIKQIDEPNLTADIKFQKTNKTAAQNVDVNFYINHQFFSRAYNQLLPDTTALAVAKAKYANWSEIDLTQKENELLLNGFSYADETSANYLQIFLSQQPLPFAMDSYLPATTAFFIFFNIENNSSFFDDYQKYILQIEKYNNKQTQHLEERKEFDADLIAFAKENLDRAVGVVDVQNNNQTDKLFVMKVKSGSTALATLLQNFKKNAQKDVVKEFRIDAEYKFEVHNFQNNNFGEQLFGSLCSGAATNWFTIYDNCLIASSTYEAVCSYLRSLILKETLANQPSFRQFNSGMTNRSSFYLWFSPNLSTSRISTILDANIYQSIVSKGNSLKKIEAFGWQFGSENGMIYNMAKLKFNPKIKTDGTTIWRSFIDGKIVGQPKFVFSIENKNQCDVVFQNDKNEFCLVGSEGQVRWKIQLPDRIMSEIYQIDYFKNGQLQFAFNTQKEIFLIDSDGKILPKFPLKLSADATNGLAIFDYENNRDYRFCIACNDHKIYSYDKKGEPVEGWEPDRTEHEVKQPIHHYRVDNKDFIVFFDVAKIYILDRKGKVRVPTTSKFANSKNDLVVEKSEKDGVRIIKSDNSGNVWAIDFAGNYKKIFEKKAASTHFFKYTDINNDKYPDYIFLDGDSLSTYNHDGSPIFKKKFEHTIDYPPYITTIDGNVKIGVISSATNQLFLYNTDGLAFGNFPLQGNSLLCVGSFTKGNNSLNLIVGTNDGFLNNYKIDTNENRQITNDTNRQK